MALDAWLFYVGTLYVYMLTPGPSHVLMLSNSLTHGFRPALATAAGDLTANALQLLAAGLGLAALIVASEHALDVVKWGGAAYLAWRGIGMICNAGRAKSAAAAGAPSLKALWLQGFMTSAVNPKAIVFFAALLPLFIAPDGAFGTQFFILAVTYIIVDGTMLGAYGAAADRVRKRLAHGSTAVVDRLGGAALIGAALLLALKSIGDV